MPGRVIEFYCPQQSAYVIADNPCFCSISVDQIVFNAKRFQSFYGDSTRVQNILSALLGKASMPEISYSKQAGRIQVIL